VSALSLTLISRSVTLVNLTLTKPFSPEILAWALNHCRHSLVFDYQFWLSPRTIWNTHQTHVLLLLNFNTLTESPRSPTIVTVRSIQVNNISSVVFHFNFNVLVKLEPYICKLKNPRCVLVKFEPYTPKSCKT